ncbi:hypothetical protein ACIRG5_38895 [Lentzea sp. NPDC102401]|uniref:hypothetical protein n=1 Tax=Lentzea sp. NPDC102401 TaxID=3364128 RepID=UPI0038022FAF
MEVVKERQEMISNRLYRSVYAETLRGLQSQVSTGEMAFANFMEVSRNTVVSWLQGDKMPGLTRSVRIARFYGRDPQELLLGIHAGSIADPRLARMELLPEHDVLKAVLAHDLAAYPSRGAAWWT